MDSEEPITRDSVLKLIERKEEIEKKLSQLKVILDKNGVGMNESLIDPEGYPKQNINVYEVRHARHEIICLQNDHKELMKKIEEGLHILHSQCNNSLSQSSNINKTKDSSLPIAKVSYVENGSPADLAGLNVDDFIISFGTVNHNNFISLKDIGEVTKHSVGREIPVIVSRFGIIHRLTLIPNIWNGKGLLGCNILPVEHVER